MVEILFKKDVVDAYPDGWSCVNCGTEFSEKTINVECLYVINTEAGTLCLKCHGDDLCSLHSSYPQDCLDVGRH